MPLVKKWQLDEHESSIDKHGDVEISTPADKEVLTYESATLKWKNKPVHDRLHDLYSTLDHQKISRGTSFPASPVDGQLFRHDGIKALFIYDGDETRWINVSDFGVAISLAAEGMIENFLTTDFLTIAVTGSGSINIGYRACRMNTGATLNSTVIVRPNNDWCFAGNGWYVFRFYTEANRSNGTIWFVAVYGSDADVSDTSRHIGFKITSDGHLHGNVGNGTSGTDVDLGYMDVGDKYILMYINHHPSPTQVRFYDASYILLGTITTNLPSQINKWLLKTMNNVGAANMFVNVRSIGKTTGRLTWA